MGLPATLHPDDPRPAGARRRAPRHAQDRPSGRGSHDRKARTARSRSSSARARGIGKGIAAALRRRGRAARAGRQRGRGRRRRPPTSSGAAFIAHRHLATWPTPRRAVALPSSAYGRLDILVQNAGIYPWTLIENTTPEEWDRVHGGQSARHLHRRPRRALPMKAQRYGPHALHLVDHRPACHQPGPRPLFGEQGRHQRLHPRRGAGVLRLRHHRQRRRARQHPDRGDAAASRRGLHQEHGRRHPARPPRHARATSPTPSSSSPPTMPATSPARPSSSTAANCCPKARISALIRPKS